MGLWRALREGVGIGGALKRDPRLRILMWATVAGLAFGAIEFGKPLEDALSTNRNVLRKHKPSGDIVVVGVDDASLEALGEWTWPRGYHARIIDDLNRLGAKRIFVDLHFMHRSDAAQDVLLARALARSRAPVTLAATNLTDFATGKSVEDRPLPLFGRHAQLANISVTTDYRGVVGRLDYACCAAEARYPSFAAKLASVRGKVGESFPVDYAIDPNAVPLISAADVYGNRLASGSLAGKDVIVGAVAERLGDNFLMPSHGVVPGVFLHVLGAETLKVGVPVSLGWMPAFLLALGGAILCARASRPRHVAAIGAGGIVVLAVAPLFLEARHIWADVAPAIFLLLTTAGALCWWMLRRSYRTRGTVNATSGLPNLDALRGRGVDGERILIATRIHNYAKIASALPSDLEGALVAQIANRLTLGSSTHELYQGDEGIFAWFSDLPDTASVGQHLDALHGFFRSSVAVGGEQIDLKLSFGVDAGTDRLIGNRLGSALVACDEAAEEGRRWKAFDPSALTDATWKLSLLGQLDRAIDAGDIWVAYQPKLDLASGTIIGAEALARWTHPEKGPIAPLDFIIAAEQNDRIEKLTRFVLTEAIAAAARINAEGVDFNIAVNISTRLIAGGELVGVVDALLRAHGLPADRLTLEVTETAALGSAPENLRTLARLRDLGVGVSIDDYGTGLSTLDYLKKIPATEIKIDQSFVGAVTKSHRDRVMVHSTVQLAHSLGRAVVAEGVEDQATLDILGEMGCDHAQGFHIGRPVSLRAFRHTLLEPQQHKWLKKA